MSSDICVTLGKSLSFSWVTSRKWGWQYMFNFYLLASLVAQMLKNLSAVGKTQVWSLGWEDPLKKGMATYSSILAWRIPWTVEPGGLQSIRVRHDWRDLACVQDIYQYPVTWTKKERLTKGGPGYPKHQPCPQISCEALNSSWQQCY